MASGVETAGLALAAFPIVVICLECYVKGAATVKRWHRYGRELHRYATKLETERITYLNTTLRLLGDIVDQEDLEAMLSGPASLLWQKLESSEYKDRLQKRLHLSYDNYAARTKIMMETLESMKRKLRIGPSGTVAWDNTSSLNMQLTRIKITLTKTVYDELLSEINGANQALKRLVDGSLEDEPRRERRRVHRNAADLNWVRQHAKSFHAAIVRESSWKCSGRCSRQHLASLLLEPRPWNLYEPISGGHEPPNVIFGVLLSTEAKQSKFRSLENGRRLEARPVEKRESQVSPSVPTPTTSTLSRRKRAVRFLLRGPVVPDTSDAAASRMDVFNLDKGRGSVGLCGELRNDRSPGYDLGFLEDDTVGGYQHHLRFLDHVEPRTCFGSLGYLLKSSEPQGSERHLSRKDRLYLALTLASSVLQLGETPWLPKQWRSTSILVLHVPQPELQTRAFNRLHPYLSCRANTPEHPGAATCGTRSEILLSLGFVLIELFFFKPLEDFELPEDSENNADDRSRRRRTAERLLLTVYEEAGHVYGEVVRGCLYCPFGLRETNIENAEFQKEVFNRIVIPLYRQLQTHCGPNIG